VLVGWFGFFHSGLKAFAKQLALGVVISINIIQTFKRIWI